MLYPTLPIWFLVIGAAICTPERLQDDQIDHEGLDPDPEDQETSEMEDHTARMEKRSPNYDFGLGKRAYSYVSENKRLPVYNFGLGKRTRPFSFGLGKRSPAADGDVEGEVDAATLLDLLSQYHDTAGLEKRARPYSFGLGKRSDLDGDVDDLGRDVDDLSRNLDDLTEQKRAKTYNFGLGKRNQQLYHHGLDKRSTAYTFGLGKRFSKFNFDLGKRYSKFNFGLGKRQRDMHRFSFGLGKRSANNFNYDNDNSDPGKKSSNNMKYDNGNHYDTGIVDY